MKLYPVLELEDSFPLVLRERLLEPQPVSMPLWDLTALQPQVTTSLRVQ